MLRVGDRCTLPVYVEAIEPHADGTATVTFSTDEPQGQQPKQFRIRSVWQLHEGKAEHSR